MLRFLENKFMGFQGKVTEQVGLTLECIILLEAGIEATIISLVEVGFKIGNQHQP